MGLISKTNLINKGSRPLVVHNPSFFVYTKTCFLVETVFLILNCLSGIRKSYTTNLSNRMTCSTKSTNWYKNNTPSNEHFLRTLRGGRRHRGNEKVGNKKHWFVCIHNIHTYIHHIRTYII